MATPEAKFPVVEETVFVIMCYGSSLPFAWEVHHDREGAIARQLDLQRLNPTSTFEILKTKLVHNE